MEEAARFIEGYPPGFSGEGGLCDAITFSLRARIAEKEGK